MATIGNTSKSLSNLLDSLTVNDLVKRKSVKPIAEVEANTSIFDTLKVNSSSYL
jgi:hypothetical protein